MLRNSTLSKSPGSAVGMLIGPDRSAGVAERGDGPALGEECASVQRTMHLCKINVLHVVGRVVILDLAARPVDHPMASRVVRSERGTGGVPGVVSRACAHSTLKTSPSSTVATGGMSGCQRLWSGGLCSHGLRLVSTVSSFFASGMMVVGVQVLQHSRGVWRSGTAPPFGGSGDFLIAEAGPNLRRGGSRPATDSHGATLQQPNPSLRRLGPSGSASRPSRDPAAGREFLSRCPS